MKKKRIIVSVISDLATDQRVIKISSTLEQMGFEVKVFARKLRKSLPLEKYDFNATRIRCFFEKGPMQYLEFNFKLFWKLLFTKTNYLLANDLDTLLPNFLISKMRGKYLFYDTHEYFTGVPELRHSPFKRKIWKALENWIFPKLKIVYTVNNSVKSEYEKEYPVQLRVIRNVPVTQSITPAPLPEKWLNKIILLVQGAGINQGRSCIELVEAMPLLDERFHLVFIGGGNWWGKIKQKRTAMRLENRFDMIEKMSPSQLKTYTPLAFLGFSLDSFEDKNHLFNLPNKIFDYLHAGVPVIATAIPEIKNIIDQYECGICIEKEKLSADHIATTIMHLASDKSWYDKLKSNTYKAAELLCWEKESEMLKAIYQSYL